MCFFYGMRLLDTHIYVCIACIYIYMCVSSVLYIYMYITIHMLKLYILRHDHNRSICIFARWITVAMSVRENIQKGRDKLLFGGNLRR